jgi:Methionine synthase I (cobalamin-dependent), methyltransferase domain
MNITFPLILDGAMGTQLLRNGMPNGACPEQWIMENPDVAYEIQKSYVDAGSQVLYTPTFGGNAACLEKHGIINKVEEYNLALAGISKKASSGKALVAGDISSTGGVLYPLGDISFDDFYEIYLEQATALEKSWS